MADAHSKAATDPVFAERPSALNYSQALERLLNAEWTARRIKEHLVESGATPNAELAAVHDDMLTLRLSTPIFWASNCLDAVSATMPSIDLADTVCSRHLLYTDYAFCWFERPFMSLRTRGTTRPMVALAWAWVVQHKTQRQMLTCSAFVEEHGLLVSDSWLSAWDGESLGGQQKDTYTAPMTPDDEENWQEEHQSILRFLVCANIFVRQKIAAAEELAPHRALRRRLSKESSIFSDRLVSVIQLRERDRHEQSSGGRDNPEWNWRWTVRGHIRQQFYPSLNAHLPVFINPYIKGPDDKPLKPRTTPIIAVTR